MIGEGGGEHRRIKRVVTDLGHEELEEARKIREKEEEERKQIEKAQEDKEKELYEKRVKAKRRVEEKLFGQNPQWVKEGEKEGEEFVEQVAGRGTVLFDFTKVIFLH